MSGATNGKLEGRVTVPSGGWGGTVDDSGGAGAVAFTVAAGDYYLSSSDASGGSTLLEALVAALNAVAPTDTFSAAIDAGEGGTGKVTLSSTGSSAIVWTDTDLRDVLGFTGDLSAGTSWTGDYQARSLWLPDIPFFNLNGGGTWRGAWESNVLQVQNDAGYVWTIGGQKRRVQEGLAWKMVRQSKVWVENEVTTRESYEQFWLDVLFGEAAWTTAPGGPIRFYPSADNDDVFGTYYATDGIAAFKPQPVSAGWVGGPWEIRLPKLIQVPNTNTLGAGTDTVTQIFLIFGQSNAVGGGDYTDLSTALASYGDSYSCDYAEMLNAPTDFLGGAPDTQTAWGSTVAPRADDGMGIELSVARQIKNRFGSNVAILKAATNGTSAWSDWDTEVANSQFAYLKSFVDARLSDYGSPCKIAGGFWIQGEADSNNNAFSNTYFENVSALFHRLWAEYGQFPIVINHLHPANTGTYASRIRSAEDHLADQLEGVSVVDTDDLTLNDGTTLHYDADSYVRLGLRMTDALPGATGTAVASVRLDVVANHLTDGASTTDGTSWDTASVTPGTNRLLILDVALRTTAGAETPTISGNGLTWTLVQPAVDVVGDGTVKQCQFWAMGQSPSTGAITISTVGAHTAVEWSLTEYRHADTGASGADALGNVDTVTSGGTLATTLTTDLTTLDDATSIHHAAACIRANTTITPDANFTELSDNPITTPNITLGTEYAVNQATCSPTWGSQACAMLAVEIKSQAT